RDTPAPQCDAACVATRHPRVAMRHRCAAMRHARVTTRHSRCARASHVAANVTLWRILAFSLGIGTDVLDGTSVLFAVRELSLFLLPVLSVWDAHLGKASFCLFHPAGRTCAGTPVPLTRHESDGTSLPGVLAKA